MAKTTKKAKTEATAIEAVANEAAATAATPETTLEPVQLTIADLQVLSRIVELASRRGAFQASELSQVGESYNKLSAFLAYVESVQKKETEATEGAGEEAAASA